MESTRALQTRARLYIVLRKMDSCSGLTTSPYLACSVALRFLIPSSMTMDSSQWCRLVSRQSRLSNWKLMLLSSMKLTSYSWLTPWGRYWSTMLNTYFDPEWSAGCCVCEAENSLCPYSSSDEMLSITSEPSRSASLLRRQFTSSSKSLMRSQFSSTSVKESYILFLNYWHNDPSCYYSPSLVSCYSQQWNAMKWLQIQRRSYCCSTCAMVSQFLVSFLAVGCCLLLVVVQTMRQVFCIGRRSSMAMLFLIF